MTQHCKLHPGRPAVLEYCSVQYCQKCSDNISAARLRVNGHVKPRDCFVTHAGGDNWKPLDGTGCAHWVAHNKNIKTGSVTCLCGFVVRVKELALWLQRNGSKVDFKGAKIGDIWISENEGHTGIVTSTSETETWIMHDSSSQGGVFKNKYPDHWSRLTEMIPGTFYRYRENNLPKENP